MSQSISFLKHNNAVPLAVFAIFGITTASFAANPDVRSAVYESRQEVRRVDNTYIVAADVKNRDFRMQVTDAREDADAFYVTYSYRDISIVDHVWQEVTTTGSMTVSKKELEGRDLGLFVAKQLGEIVNTKRDYLASVQKHERAAGATTKVVATTYAGIVGKFLDPEEKTFPGYVAVIEPKSPQYENPVPANVPDSAHQEDPGGVSVSIPNANNSQVQLTQAQIEQIVAEQVRAILAGAAAPAPATETSTSTAAAPAPDAATTTETVAPPESGTTTPATETVAPPENSTTTGAIAPPAPSEPAPAAQPAIEPVASSTAE